MFHCTSEKESFQQQNLYKLCPTARNNSNEVCPLTKLLSGRIPDSIINFSR